MAVDAEGGPSSEETLSSQCNPPHSVAEELYSLLDEVDSESVAEEFGIGKLWIVFLKCSHSSFYSLSKASAVTFASSLASMWLYISLVVLGSLCRSARWAASKPTFR
jgi:hypothetical protein